MRSATGFSMAALAAIGAIATTPGFAQNAHTPPVLAQELANVRASGKVMTALWTARKDTYTLQLVFPINGMMLESPRTTRTANPAPSPQPQPNRVQVWLLKADGTQVFTAHGRAAPKVEGWPAGGRTISYTLTYSFPPTESREAVAVAISINDQFYIDQLKPLR